METCGKGIRMRGKLAGIAYLDGQGTSSRTARRGRSKSFEGPRDDLNTLR